MRLSVQVVERKVFGIFTLHLSDRKEWGATVAHWTGDARHQGDGSDGPTIGTGELIDFFFVVVVPGCRRAHGCSSLKPGGATRMPGPELQVWQALPKRWAIGGGRRLSAERADFATIPWVTGGS